MTNPVSLPERLLDRWWLAVQVLPLVVLLVTVKVVIVSFDGDFIDSVSLVETVVAGNVFVLGFLLAGTLADYKEGERLPGEIAASLDTIADEFEINVRSSGTQESRHALVYLARLAGTIREWFYGAVTMDEVLGAVTALNEHFRLLEARAQANFVTRIKQQQAHIRGILIRVETIRETQFVAAGYAMAELGTFLVLVGFLFVDVGPALESAFFTALVTFLLAYVVLLIRDLDNPFDHYTGNRETARVSLHPVIEVERRLQERAAAFGSEGDERLSVSQVLDAVR